MGNCEGCQAEVPDEELTEKDGKKVCKTCAGAGEAQEGGGEQKPSE